MGEMNRPIVVKRAILDQEWNLEPSGRKQGGNGVVFFTDNVGARQAGGDAQPCHSQGVVVIPERRGQLRVEVFERGGGKCGAGFFCVFRKPGRHEAVRAGRCDTAMQVGHHRNGVLSPLVAKREGLEWRVGHRHSVGIGEHDCGIDGENMIAVEFIPILNADLVITDCLEGRSGCRDPR